MSRWSGWGDWSSFGGVLRTDASRRHLGSLTVFALASNPLRRFEPLQPLPMVGLGGLVPPLEECCALTPPGVT